jgi:hypothetical protein
MREQPCELFGRPHEHNHNENWCYHCNEDRRKVDLRQYGEQKGTVFSETSVARVYSFNPCSAFATWFLDHRFFNRRKT